MSKAIFELRTTQWDRKRNSKNIWKNMFTVKSFKVFTSFILADARCPRLRTLSALGNQQKWSYLHRIQLQKEKKILSLYFKGKTFTKSIPDIWRGTQLRIKGRQTAELKRKVSAYYQAKCNHGRPMWGGEQLKLPQFSNFINWIFFFPHDLKNKEMYSS